VVERAVAALRSGETVILPTDTVYGLCVAPEHAARLSELKGRPASMPVALLCATVERLLELVPGSAGYEALLPGPYTLILRNPAGRFPELGGGETIGVRVPVLAGAAAEVLRRVGAVAATSANRHGGGDPRRLDDVTAELRRACAAEVDGGELPGVASTVIDLTGPHPRVLREGAVPAAETLRRLGRKAE
jgi:tRNA threonylcarbamoyl adenosine modification protein (Sua5/YciO/YrdC/YwlC family)